ncbi:Adaptor protein complex 3 (AP-3), delta subunit [Monocercomonoides exilis]|uniref:Adaptor protein complex 3 (AP-3), delta subunit n=1 Tax=Monocercomonoides exilis TaxID=2049356 RepID=UPI00355A4D3F|nr:Adaptor protein complex 3 (AP-3), delta subunit [Monocercomonoides exilis]|eukprot:MONOS_11292.1-p1 / transcript=MONOS_11292.1 / gene=MONOS_11292 / organism=Monocercomonoides_exilis_PA203 / gene_product= Adaptor protein complex 3 (AP-3), delta subunit / transcript_product= Adaptor protein complex 3 (AP-3), delta subunit / location=Mono_scaffold00559:17909-21692(+) / protein_length=1206 / sequence_SO=supercontig / SO=protein_coding / is_pseudo=false
MSRFFTQTLTDLIKSIRENSRNEVAFVNETVRQIREELKTKKTTEHGLPIQKLAYLHLLGYDQSWAAFNVVQVMAQPKFYLKRIGYLTATQFFEEGNDCIMLATQTIKKDFSSRNQYEVGLALTCVANLCNEDLANNTVSDIVGMLNSQSSYIKKRAIIACYRIMLKVPANIRAIFPRLKDKLEDPDPGVCSAAVSVFTELAFKNPKNVLELAPQCYKLLVESNQVWMQIKLVKLLGCLFPLEPRLPKKMADVLLNLISSTHAKSLQFECIRAALTACQEVPAFVPTCVDRLREFVTDNDPNLTYLGLWGLSQVMKIHPKAVVEHRALILECLKSPDTSIRLRSLDIIAGMISQRTFESIAENLLEILRETTGDSTFKTAVVEKLLTVAMEDNYAKVPDFEWLVELILKLSLLGGVGHGELMGRTLLDVMPRVKAVRARGVRLMVDYISKVSLDLLSFKGVAQRGNNDFPSDVIESSAWCIGEYCDYVATADGDDDDESDSDSSSDSDDDSDDGHRHRGKKRLSEEERREKVSEVVMLLLNPSWLSLPASAQASLVWAALKVLTANPTILVKENISKAVKKIVKNQTLIAALPLSFLERFAFDIEDEEEENKADDSDNESDTKEDSESHDEDDENSESAAEKAKALKKKKEERTKEERLLRSLLEYARSPYIEVQERAFLVFNVIVDAFPVDDFEAIFSEEMKVVSKEAQSKVPIVEGLELDEVIDKAWKRSTEEDSDDEDNTGFGGKIKSGINVGYGFFFEPRKQPTQSSLSALRDEGVGSGSQSYGGISPNSSPSAVDTKLGDMFNIGSDSKSGHKHKRSTDREKSSHRHRDKHHHSHRRHHHRDSSAEDESDRNSSASPARDERTESKKSKDKEADLFFGSSTPSSKKTKKPVRPVVIDSLDDGYPDLSPSPAASPSKLKKDSSAQSSSKSKIEDLSTIDIHDSDETYELPTVKAYAPPSVGGYASPAASPPQASPSSKHGSHRHRHRDEDEKAASVESSPKAQPAAVSSTYADSMFILPSTKRDAKEAKDKSSQKESEKDKDRKKEKDSKGHRHDKDRHGDKDKDEKKERSRDKDREKDSEKSRSSKKESSSSSKKAEKASDDMDDLLAAFDAAPRPISIPYSAMPASEQPSTSSSSSSSSSKKESSKESSKRDSDKHRDRDRDRDRDRGRDHGSDKKEKDKGSDKHEKSHHSSHRHSHRH